jgi:hypothetical protein
VLEERRALQVAGRDLVGRHVEGGEEVGTRDVEGRREEVHAELARVFLQRLVLVEAELQEFAVLAVGRAEAVLVVVRPVVRRGCIKPPVVALLQLDCVRAGELRLAEQLSRLVEAALMVVSDFRNDIALRLVADLVTADSECACQ